MSKSQLTLHEHLKKIFGFSSFKGRQEEIIKNLQAGNDSLVIMPTGGGKSMCYQLPALIDEGVAIIVSPLIALMKNQVDALRGFNEDDRIAHVLNSSLNKQQVQEVKDDLSSGKTKLLRSEEHTSELQSQAYLVCRLLLEKKKKKKTKINNETNKNNKTTQAKIQKK